MNKTLLDHIKNDVFPIYNNNDDGHNLNHIKYVIERSAKLSSGLDVNPDMVYVIAAYHDCGCYIDRENHEIISAKIFSDDKVMKNYFTSKQINTIKEAIEDHRASLEYEPRSIYGKIVSSADRNTSVEMSLKRSHDFQIKDNLNTPFEVLVENSYQKLNSKFGNGGYAKMYIKDQLYEDYLKEMQNLLSSKDNFSNAYKLVNGL